MPTGKWTPPESGNAPAEVKHILETVYSAYRDEHPEENEKTKSHGAAVAWAAVKKQGWRKNRQGEWTKTRKAKFSELLNGMLDRLEFVSKREDVSKSDKERAKEKYGDVNYADEANKKYPLDTEEHVRAAASYFGMQKNRSKYSAADQKKIDGKIAAAEKKFKIGKKEMSEKLNVKEFAMIKVKDTPIFRAGTYTHTKDDGSKITTTFTEDDLDQMVNNYNAQSPPVFIPGHTSDYAVESAIPKVGVVGGLRRVGKELIATGVQFVDKLVDAIKDGFYDDRSVETYKDEKGWNIYRVGVLGAQPPKVKGMIPLLDSIQMSDPPKNLLSFQMDATMIEEMENAAEEDTVKNIDECFAMCLSKIEDHLNMDDEPDECRQHCLNALMECYSGVCEEINEHFTFMGKLEQLEPEEKEEMMEKISNKIKQLLHFGANSQTKRKESVMDDKQLKEFQEKEKALELEKTSLATQKAELEKQQLAFSEKEKALKTEEAKKADEAIKIKVQAFKEDLIAKKYPVKKMEEAGIFVLAENMLRSQPIQFGEEKKEPFAILRSLISNFQPVNTSIVEMKDEEKTSMTKSAQRLHIPAGARVSKQSMERIQFSERYLEKNRATIPGENDKQKLGYIMTKVMSGELQVTSEV